MVMAESQVENSAPFEVRDCALITLSTGLKAQNLKEFLMVLQKIPAESIEHHFWGRFLQPQFDEPEYNNDFASWASRGLYDKQLAERLSMVLPTDFEDIECLRQELIDVVEERLDETELVPWAKADQQFYFLRSQTIIFDSGLRFAEPAEIVSFLPSLSTGSIYFHFIDARNRTPRRCDDFSAWLDGFGDQYQVLRNRLLGVDPYFSSLKELRRIVTDLFQRYFQEEA
jgi:hypothetical protein